METKSSKHLIYITFHDSSKSTYIGKSSSGLLRPQKHGKPYNLKINSDYPIVKWIKKLKSKGFDYNIEILEEFPDLAKLNPKIEAERKIIDDTLNEAEMFYIAYFKSLGYPLLNCTNGGEGCSGYKHTKETKQKMKVKTKNRHKGEGNPMYGKRHSEDAKQKISIANKGKRYALGAVRSEETKQKLHLANLGKNPPNKGIPMSNEQKQKLSIKLNGNKNCLGRILSEETKLKISRSHGGRPFKDQYGNVYQTQYQAAIDLELRQGKINLVLHGKRKSTGGYIFAYIEESNE